MLGIIIFILVWINFSFDIALVAAAALVFIPIPAEGGDRYVNMGLTVVLMGMVLFMTRSMLGLSFSIETGLGTGLFITAIVLAGIRIGWGIKKSADDAPIIAGGGTPPEPPKTWLFITVSSVILIIASILFLQPWTWPFGTIIFITAWVIAMIGGMGGSATGNWSTKAGTGLVLFLVVFVIYAGGVGTQEVGSAFFGQLWPQVYTMGSQFLEPIMGISGQLQSQLGGGLEMLTNPTAFAQRIMNGSYQKDPNTGLAGAYGVEIDEMRVTPIHVLQPYQVILKLNNKGAYDASDIVVTLMPGEKAPKGITMEKIGMGEDPSRIVNDMMKGSIEQVIMASGLDGVDCGAYKTYNLYEKSLPIDANITYRYSIDSSLELEFISRNEWDRLVSEGEAITTRKKAATLKNSPAQLNIDTLEQPIREGTPHFIGLTLTPSQKGGEVTGASIHLEMPKTLIEDAFESEKGDSPREEIITCTPQKGGEEPVYDYKSKADSVIIKWNEPPAGNTVYCRLTGYRTGDLQMEVPTQTLLVQARANFTFSNKKSILTKATVVGGCCRDGDCGEGKECTGESDDTLGICATKASAPASS